MFLKHNSYVNYFSLFPFQLELFTTAHNFFNNVKLIVNVKQNIFSSFTGFWIIAGIEKKKYSVLVFVCLLS